MCTLSNLVCVTLASVEWIQPPSHGRYSGAPRCLLFTAAFIDFWLSFSPLTYVYASVCLHCHKAVEAMDCLYRRHSVHTTHTQSLLACVCVCVLLVCSWLGSDAAAAAVANDDDKQDWYLFAAAFGIDG